MAKKPNTEHDFDLQPEHILRELMGITLQELKLGHEPWQKLSQSKQSQIIERVSTGAKSLLRRLLALLSSEGFVRVQAHITKVEIVDAGIKATLTVSKGESSRASLYESQGQLSTLVLVDAEKFTNAPHGFLADVDQFPLPLPDASANDPDQDELDKAKADALAAALELPPVTREQIDELYARILDMRRIATDAGVIEDSAEILALVAERDALMVRLQAQEAAPILTPAQETAAAIQALDVRIAAAENELVDWVETPALAEMRTERQALVLELGARQKVEVEAAEAGEAAAQLDRMLTEDGTSGTVETADGTVLLELGKAA